MDTQGFIIPICSKPDTNSPMILKVNHELLDFMSVHVFAMIFMFLTPAVKNEQYD